MRSDLHNDNDQPYHIQLVRAKKLLKTLGLDDEHALCTYLTKPSILYVQGDATQPILGDSEFNVIVHCCNNIGAWGAGFTGALDKVYPEAGVRFRKWTSPEPAFSDPPYVLGAVQIIPTRRKQVFICNLVGQNGIRGPKNPTPIDYEAIKNGFSELLEFLRCYADRTSSIIHMPRLGAGLAGGDWNQIEILVQQEFVDKGYTVIVYDLR